MADLLPVSYTHLIRATAARGEAQHKAADETGTATKTEAAGCLLSTSLTLSEYARQMVLAGKVIAPASPEELGLIAELTREKNNLNQLAKVQNAAGDVYKRQVFLFCAGRATKKEPRKKAPLCG